MTFTILSIIIFCLLLIWAIFSLQLKMHILRIISISIFIIIPIVYTLSFFYLLGKPRDVDWDINFTRPDKMIVKSFHVVDDDVYLWLLNDETNQLTYYVLEDQTEDQMKNLDDAYMKSKEQGKLLYYSFIPEAQKNVETNNIDDPRSPNESGTDSNTDRKIVTESEKQSSFGTIDIEGFPQYTKEPIVNNGIEITK